MVKKGKLFISLFISPLLFACTSNKINTPTSPFVDDTYNRIGMVGEFIINSSMNQDEFSNVRNYLNNATEDLNVKSYHRQEETRDLKYAYFGDESSVISQCTLTSRSEDSIRYKNRVRINKDTTIKESQVKNGGIVKDITTSTDYTFDKNYKKQEDYGKYQEVIKTEINQESPRYEERVKEDPYDVNNPYLTFGLKPFTTSIRSHFKESEIRGKTYDFKLLGENNHAVYGKDKNDNYIIKEGYSLFADFSTTMGRYYKAQDNFFYEGKISYDNVNKIYQIINFRFYHELLILSESCDGTGVPILYLDKPALINYSEVTYSNFVYQEENQLDVYKDDLPPKSE